MLGEENTAWMGKHRRVGETGISESGPSNQPLPNFATNFFDQEGRVYFGELEEALMQGVVGIKNEEDKKSFLTNRPPPTLEIFPSWPMRFQQTNQGNSQPAESTGSESGQNTISQLESEQSSKPSDKQHQMMAAPNHELSAQDKDKVGGSTAERNGKTRDAKTLRRLAQNREAAKKSRLRKKAYVQNLESSRMRLAQLEQDLQRARSQGLFFGAGYNSSGNTTSGATMFDLEYVRWLDDNNKHMMELRGCLQAHLPDGDLRVVVDDCLAHYDEIFRLKGVAAKTDAFHLLTGMWTTPAERCFIWIGGFRPSHLLKVLMPQLDPLTEQQLMGICSLQQSSQQAEEALLQGLEQLQRSITDTVVSGSLQECAHVGNYMGHMAMALEKLANLEGFIRQEHVRRGQHRPNHSDRSADDLSARSIFLKL